MYFVVTAAAGFSSGKTPVARAFACTESGHGE